MSASTAPSPLATPEPWDLVRDGYVAELWDQFSNFAASALDLAELPEEAEVLDVATGPGTLAVQAARRARRVVALDFSARMLEDLEQRVRKDGLTNVEVVHGDGQVLPFADASFDRAFSMFGLIFFPDRGQGFRELRRVLRPGGRAVVASWRPFVHTPPIHAVFEVLVELMPELPFGKSSAPLGEPDAFKLEMQQAGFDAVDIRVVSHGTTAESPAALWASMERSTAPLLLLRRRVGEERWSELSAQLRARLLDRFGPGPLRVEPQALLGIGTRA